MEPAGRDASREARTSVSAVLNIAKAAGKPTAGGNKKHFAIARGSALECGAVLDTLKDLGSGETALIERGKGLLVDVVSILTKLCK